MKILNLVLCFSLASAKPDDFFGKWWSELIGCINKSGSSSFDLSESVQSIIKRTSVKNSDTPSEKIKTIINSALHITNLPASIDVKENTDNTTILFTVQTDATDSSSVQFTIENSQNFTINSDGVVTVKPGVVLDYETSTRQMDLNIKATDKNGVSDIKTLTINISNVNEPPVFDGLYRFTFEEGKKGTVVIDSFLPYVRDEDVGDKLTFSLVPEGNYEYFHMDPSTGAMSYAKDYDVFNHRYVRMGLRARVEDSGGLSDTGYFEIWITFVNQAPTLVNLPDTIEIPSNTLNNVTIFKVNVSDTDMFDHITTSVNYQPPEASQYFTFNPTDKAVKFRNGERIRGDRTFKLQFTATDNHFTVDDTLTVKVVYIPG